ncbi:MAG: SUMF1/EgtB/PvdO family nonheme iron enzyme, partial [Gammaproteobacteria bacterium]|nr:SUMF1/EgtB/PvdO family nonheme iron enzyme [Gammaproteobacteria bacterium]
PAENRIRKSGESIPVQHLSMQVLAYLARHHDRVVSYPELLDALWPGRYAGEEAVHRRIADLRQLLGDDARAPRYIETVPKVGYRLLVQPAFDQPLRWPLAAIAVIAAAAITASLLTGNKRDPDNPGGDALLARIEQLADAGEYREAAALIEPLLAVDRPAAAVTALAAEVILPVMVESTPFGAKVSAAPYDQPDADWETLGVTPFETDLPRGTWRLRLIADGHEPLELAAPNPGPIFNNAGEDYHVITLPPRGSVPAGMVFVPRHHGLLPLMGYRRPEDLGEFYIGRTEVSNAEFAEFVAAGGYGAQEYWSDLPDGSDELDFELASRRFVDSTGMPGPAGWGNGTYPPGDADLPVTGVSWYEAMAYARYRRALLPTARHWARAALGLTEYKWPLAPALLATAQLQGAAPVAVEAGHAISTFGAIHMIGNVREWTRSYSGNMRLSLGSSYRGPEWQYALPALHDPLSRLPDQGFRLAVYDESFPDEPLALDGQPPTIPLLDDAQKAGVRARYTFENGSVGVDDAELVYERDEGQWLRRRILLPVSDPAERLPVHLFVPKERHGPLQPVLFVPPGDNYQSNRSSDEIDISRYDIDFIIRGGRALVWPIYWQTNERITIEPEERARAGIAAIRDALDRRRDEFGRVIDYLEAAPEFDGARIGLLAISFGATFVSPQVLATEDRFRAGVLLAAGLAPVDPNRLPAELNPNAYWGLVRLPLLIANGRRDITKPYDPGSGRLVDALGTDAADKRFVLYESAHWPLPPRRMREDVNAWFDRYLGVVE